MQMQSLQNYITKGKENMDIGVQPFSFVLYSVFCRTTVDNKCKNVCLFIYIFNYS